MCSCALGHLSMLFIHDVYVYDVCIRTNFTPTGDIATSTQELDVHAPKSRIYLLTGYQDAASSFALPAALSSHIMSPLPPAAWCNSTIVSSEASVGPCFPAVPMATPQQASYAMMTAPLDASTWSSHSPSLVVMDWLQFGTHMSDWNIHLDQGMYVNRTTRSRHPVRRSSSRQRLVTTLPSEPRGSSV